MPRVFARRLAARLALATLGLISATSAVNAQTTVTLQAPRTHAWYATVRGGTYANTNLSTILETRASDDPEYVRRGLLKFDTQNTIPAGASVTSAYLTITVKQGSGSAARMVAALQVTTSWEDVEVTYKLRRTATPWNMEGGDYGAWITHALATNVPGSKLYFDITSQVRQAVSGALGSSRYTRVALVDFDAPTSESWRAYYTSSESNAALRPTLTVTYGSAAALPPPPPPTTGSVLRVLHYNIGKNGWGTDGRYDPNRIVSVVTKVNPDIISFNEVERWNSYSQGADGVELYKSLLEQKTGVTWYVWHAQSYGVWDDKGLINVVYSKIPFSATYRTIYSAGKLKSVGGVTITFNGRPINFMTTHFDPYSDAYRLTQARDLATYMRSFAENRIVAGDFNDQSYDPPITTMTASYFDAWAEAKKAGIASAPPDNPDGNTRNSRIDYIFYSRGEQHLTLRKVQVVETRDANGVMPSDHRPVVAEFLVQ